MLIMKTLYGHIPFIIWIKIYNIFGQEMFMSSKINGKRIVIDRGNHPSGIYFMKLISSKNEIQTLKLIVND